MLNDREPQMTVLSPVTWYIILTLCLSIILLSGRYLLPITSSFAQYSPEDVWLDVPISLGRSACINIQRTFGD